MNQKFQAYIKEVKFVNAISDIEFQVVTKCIYNLLCCQVFKKLLATLHSIREPPTPVWAASPKFCLNLCNLPKIIGQHKKQFPKCSTFFRI